MPALRNTGLRTDPERMVCELEQPYILLHDKKLSALAPLLPILEAVVQSSRPLATPTGSATRTQVPTTVRTSQRTDDRS